MTKAIAEQSNALSIFFLKKHGYLPQGESWSSGGAKWTIGSWENNISFVVKTSGDEPETIETSYIELIYTINARSADEKKENIRYKIPLITTPCNYGGKRYWFVCPLYKNGQYCGRRVGVIYSISKWFGCRHCGDIAYSKQMEGGKYRWNGVSIPDLEKAEKEIKRYYYNGKPTRKYKRYMRLNDKFEMGWVLMAARLDKRFEHLANLKKR
ncbi:MAG: hypothetical protein AB1465_03765 [Patescibacteria group bacterium]